jgi:replicative DNA helicase
MNPQAYDRLSAREQEQAVLGALLINNDAIDRIGNLEPAHFFDHHHRTIYRVIQQMVLANHPADVITVYERIQAEGIEGIDLAYLNALHSNTPSAANIVRYADIVRDRAIKRELIALAREAADETAQSADGAEVLVDRLTSSLEKLSHTVTKSEPVLAVDELAEIIEWIDARYQGDAELDLVPTGFDDIDALLNGGLPKGGLIVVAARPKMGKSAWSKNVLVNMAREGKVVLDLNLEMSKRDMQNRNLASIGRLDLNKVIDPKKMEDDDWPRLTYAVQQINDMRLYQDAQPGMTLMDVRNKAKAIKRKAGRLDAILIDYLQLMDGPGDSENVKYGNITRGLKTLAKELGVPILLLSQLNRKLEDRPNKRPKPSDLRDSGAIEQDCDMAIFLYRDEIYNEDSPDKGMCEVNVALNRQGATGTRSLVYIAHHVRFENAARGYRPTPRTNKQASKGGFRDDD